MPSFRKVRKWVQGKAVKLFRSCYPRSDSIEDEEISQVPDEAIPEAVQVNLITDDVPSTPSTSEELRRQTPKILNGSHHILRSQMDPEMILSAISVMDSLMELLFEPETVELLCRCACGRGLFCRCANKVWESQMRSDLLAVHQRWSETRSDVLIYLECLDAPVTEIRESVV